jgi:hypothetical protein
MTTIRVNTTITITIRTVSTTGMRRTKIICPQDSRRRISYHPDWKSNSCDTEHFPWDCRSEFSPCSREIEHMLPPPPPDCTHVVIGGHFVSLNKRTDVVMDIFHFEM